MKRVVVQYKVKPDRAELNADLVRAVYQELEDTRPADLRYATLRLDDGVTFIHIAEQPEEGESPLTKLESFQRFQSGITARCDEPPAVREASEVGSFRLFAT